MKYKHLIIVLTLVICLFTSSCSPTTKTTLEVSPTPSVKPVTQEDILNRASDKTYTELITQTIDKTEKFFIFSTGHGADNLSDVTSADFPMAHDGAPKLLTMERNGYKIECLRLLSEKRLYTIYKTNANNLIYTFYTLDSSTGEWLSEKMSYMANKPLNKADFDAIKVGSTLQDVINIDPAQNEYYYVSYLRDGDIKHTTYHLTKQGLLTITYNNSIDNCFDSNQLPQSTLTVEALQWSDPLPILDKDYPQK